MKASRGTEELDPLANYAPRGYPPIAVTVDVALLTICAGRFSVLLVQRGNDPYKGQWALPGGFVEPDEDLAEAARRELAEETGVRDDIHLEQLCSYGAPGRDPRTRTVSVAYLGMSPEVSDPVGGSDAARARFWPVSELHGDGDQLAFDHDLIVSDSVERARSKLEYTPLAAAFCPDEFTLADLRRIYEAVWGVQLDPANFRRKVLSTRGFVEAVGATIIPPGGGRPARLYRRGDARLLHPAMLRPGASAEESLAEERVVQE
ncbi:MAG: NUDIX hydrolase [Actinomycetota bacterium]